MGARESIYLADDEAHLERLVAQLGTHFTLGHERASRSTTYYDTFDWRLWRRGERLEVEPTQEGVLAAWTGGASGPRRTPLTSEPGFATELPPGDFRDSLAAVIAMRRLLPVAEVRGEGRLIRVLDRRRKTVVRLNAEMRKTRRPGSKGRFVALRPRLKLVPVKGYHRQADKVSSWLRGLDLPGSEDWDELEEAAAALGREVGDYGDKVVARLDPTLAADRAVRQALRPLLGKALANEQGVIEDTDSEFLHDFRVSVRRTRSALGQIKGVFDVESLGPLRRELSWLGSATGPTRDLDVYLLKLPLYAGQLPEHVRADLLPLAKRLEEAQREAHGALAMELTGPRYRGLKRSWASFLKQEPDEADRTLRGREPIPDVAVACIARAYRKVLKKGAAIVDDSPAESLHRLRLLCKKLRYLMELFRSLFPAKEIELTIRALKEFQDNLGDFQDYGVQQHMLRRLATELEGASIGGPDALMAIGRLVAELEKGEARERRRFAKSFAHFSSKRTAKRFRKMLRHGGVA